MMMPLGPVMADVAGLSLTGEERMYLRHPLVGAVILFARNYSDPEQLRALTADIRSLREPSLLIAVDHEGGRVQRFREGFTAIPPMRILDNHWSRDQLSARDLAQAMGTIIGAELAAAGVDFSFTPVLDVDFGESSVIGDRAFSRHPEAIGDLAGALMRGLHSVGVAAVGKHFPGHGFAAADSHVAIPVDERPYDRIDREDLLPYRLLIPQGLDAVMPAHVIYSAVDSRPAGFSAFWLQEVLRKGMGFDGLIFSDDLTMEGASGAGDIVARAHAAFNAGCDMVLVCNAPDAARQLLEGLSGRQGLSAQRAERMRAGPREEASRVAYQAALRLLSEKCT